jgi:hypothetical protein
MMTDTPLETLAYTLTPADALAYETLPRELAGWRSALLVVWLGVAGGSVAWLPAELIGPEWGWRFWLIGLGLVGVAYGIAAVAMTLTARRRARRRIPGPLAVELRRWGDHLEIERAGQRSFVAYETIAAVTVADAHVFVVAPPEVLIIPLRAFPDRAAMLVFGETVDRSSQQSAI